MFRKNFTVFLAFGLFLIFLYYASYYNKSVSKSPPVKGEINFKSDVSSTGGMVSSASRYASQVGIDVLQKGGNAVDAAVAMGFALAVTFPQAGNIGGGGFMVLRVKDSVITSIDYREKAPSSASRDMFLDDKGNYVPEKSQEGYLSIGVPGSVAGLFYALEKYGTMNRSDVMNPAIDLAENGFEIEPRFAESLNANFGTFKKYESSKKIFTMGGINFTAGDLFVQKDLAKTLKLIRDNGRDGFYAGETADLFEKEMKDHGGLITKEDLANYQAVERKPLSSNYKGYDIYSMPPPSSGGVALICLLNMIERQSVPDRHSAYYGVRDYSDYLHYVIESMKRVFADRSQYLGDPDFYNVPVDKLISKDYAKQRVEEIGANSTSSSEIKPGIDVNNKEGNQTTHYSVIDKDGNMVSATTTLNNYYGSFVTVDGAGFLLNDEMDDFSSKPGTPNMFGLLGSDANSVQPNKRMLSSMTPTIILRDGKPFMITGSPGGGRIITIVLESILNVIDFKLPLDEAIDKPRFHDQLYPEYVETEKGAIDDEVKQNLTERGYQFKEISDYGNVSGILIDWSNHIYYGHADRRGYGLAIGY